VYVGDGRAKKQRSEDERSKSRHQNQAVVHKKFVSVCSIRLVLLVRTVGALLNLSMRAG